VQPLLPQATRGGNSNARAPIVDSH